MISYAQNFEDVMLARVFKSKVSPGFYIDVGAMDPEEGSVTRHFYDLGWRGVNIEPDLRYYNKLLAERGRDINLNVAVGESEEVATFYQFEAQGISTFNERFRDYFTRRSFCHEAVQRKVATLSNICQEYARDPIDFLKIDAEGWEAPIIRGANWTRFRPVVLVIEATEPFSHTPLWDEWDPLLVTVGYVFVYFDGLNRFYLRHESLSLRDAFNFPPNALDGFTLRETVRAQQERDAFRTEGDSLRSKIERLCESSVLERRRAESLDVERELEKRRAEHFQREAREARTQAERCEQTAAEALSRAEILQREASEARAYAEAAIRERDNERARADALQQRSLYYRLWVGQLSQELSLEKEKSRNPNS